MKEIIEFLKSERIVANIKFGTVQNHQSVLINIRGKDVEIRITENMTVKKFKKTCNDRYLNILREDLQYHDMMFKSLKRSIDEFETIWK